MFNYELTTGHLYSEGCEANLTEFLEVANSFTNHPLFICSSVLPLKISRIAVFPYQTIGYPFIYMYKSVLRIFVTILKHSDKFKIKSVAVSIFKAREYKTRRIMFIRMCIYSNNMLTGFSQGLPIIR